MSSVLDKIKGSSKIAEVLFFSNSLKNSVFTVESIKTGKDYTFKVKKNEFNGKVYTHVYVEVGYLNFKYLGYYKDGRIYEKGGVEVRTESSMAIAWIFRKVERNQMSEIDNNINFYHIGKCCKCGRALTDVRSIEYGLGPNCRTF